MHSNLLLLRLAQLQIQLVELRLVDVARGVEHHVAAGVVLREGDVVADRLRAAEQRTQPVEAEGETAVRGRAELEGVHQEAEAHLSLFGREAHINLTGDFGYLAFGLQPVFGSTLGQHGLFRAIDPLFANYTEAFGSGHASASMWTRVDNAISYVTPTWAGFTFYGMYSFQNSSKTATGYYKDGAREGSAEVDRYASLAARYQAGALEAVAVYDTTMYGNDRARGTTHDDNGQTFTFGGNYTFDGGLKVLAFGQWFKDQELGRRAGVMSSALTNNGFGGSYGFVDGYGLSLGVNYPIGGGVAKAQVAYRDMDNQDDVEFKRWTVAAAYDYPLSKRTAVYAMTGYTQESMEGVGTKGKIDADPKGYEFTVGMVHRF